MSYENTVKPWSGMYMQQSTYKHDFVPANGISPRNRQTNYPYGADAPKADIAPPYTNFRPRFSDPLPPHIRDLDGQRYDDQPLTDRQRVKRGEEWIGGRRYDEPLTDRGQYYERDRGRDISPNRRDDRMYKPEDGRYTSLDRRDDRMYNIRDDGRYTSLDRQNLRLRRHASLDRYDLMDKRKENLKQYIADRRRGTDEGRYQDRGMNGSPERYYDRGRDLDRGRGYDRARDGSPSKFREYDQGRNAYNGYNDRYYDASRDKFKYPDWYEQPVQPGIESYADHKKMADRTTYKDYGEFLQEKIKMEELRKQPLEYPAANLKGQLSHRDTYREQMYGPDNENRYYTRDNQRFSNRDRERELEAQIRREMGKIEMHDGNFKPWGRDAYQNPSHHPPKSTNSGVYLFVRTNKLAKADVVKALQEGRSVLANSYGQLKGIATSREIQLLEGNEGWDIHAHITRTGDYWLEQSRESTEINDIIIVIWFPTFNDAEKWVISEKHFKISNYPDPYGSDVLILPLNDSQPQERIAYTYLMTEYPRTMDSDHFRDVFAPRIRALLQKKYGINEFFIQSVGAKVIRGSWLKNNSIVTGIQFRNRREAQDFFFDPEYRQIRQDIHRRIENLPFYTNRFKPVSFLFTLDAYV
ncbi:uncharacterized protein LOC134244914 isoform X5 [Saccostrea cucullata]|uniref:uncharacterized protein LOC134244914 isoform X5 n=1 Tax=Saccostrea cuccullata TaxID=36930 RepID=UPI002ED667F1